MTKSGFINEDIIVFTMNMS